MERFVESFLCLFTLCNIENDPRNSQRHTRLIALNGASQHLHHPFFAVRPDDAVLVGFYDFPGKQIAYRLFAKPHIVGMDQFPHRGRFPVEFLRRDAIDSEHLSGPGELIIKDVPTPIPQVSDRLSGCQTRFASPQLFFGLLSLRNVTKHHLSRSVPLINDRARRHFRVDFRSVQAKESGLIPPYRQKIVGELLNPLFHNFSVIGVYEVEMLLS